MSQILQEEENTVTNLTLLFTELDTVSSKQCSDSDQTEGVFIRRERWVSTSYMDISDYYALKYELAAHKALMSVAFFDTDKNYISGVSTDSFLETATTVIGYVTIPEKAKYVRFIDFLGIINGTNAFDAPLVTAYRNQKSYEAEFT